MSANDGIAEAQSPSGDDCLALFTDLYQLTMLQAYFEEGMTERAVFSLFVRRLPRNRNFLVACGLDTVLDYLESLRFTQRDLDYLGTLKIFSDRFLYVARRLPLHRRCSRRPRGHPGLRERAHSGG